MTFFMSVLEMKMNLELTITTSTIRTKVFLQNGFFNPLSAPAHMHKHNFTEIHVFLNGTADIIVDGIPNRIQDGYIIAIPAGCLHELSNCSSELLHSAFQIEESIGELKTISLPPNTIALFFDEIEKSKKTQSFTKVSAFISLFCCDLYPEHQIKANAVKDYSFIINEFFFNDYSSDITLSTLADLLHLSEKQTERLVIKTMGCTFKKALTNIRTSTADHLIKTTDMSLTEVAEYVGYRSYSGFWKAYTKHT